MAKVFSKGGWGTIIVPLVVVGLALAYFLVPEKKQEEDIPDNSASAELTLEFKNLPPNEGDHYEMWLRDLYGGEQAVTGFKVMPGGSVTSLAGEPLLMVPLQDIPNNGYQAIVTIEKGDTQTEKRSERVVLKGEFKQVKAELKEVIPDISGKQYALLANPSLGDKGVKGVWFAKTLKSGRLTPGLDLPSLPKGWMYGAWVVTDNGTNLFAGLFSDVSQNDKSNFYYSGTGGNVPGEDFLRNAPEGVKFPLELNDGKTQVILSAEPDYREEKTSQKPFLPIMTGRIPYHLGAGDNFSLDKVDQKELPNGLIEIKRK